MQNLANITRTEVAVVGSAILVFCVVPTVLAWSDARRRRRALAKAAALEAAARESAAREAAAVEAAAREAAAREAAAHEAAAREAAASEATVPAPSAPLAGLESRLLWDEPTVTLDADVLCAPAALAADAAVFEVPAEPATPAPLDAQPPSAAPAPLPPLAPLGPTPLGPAPVGRAQPVSESAVPVEPMSGLNVRSEPLSESAVPVEPVSGVDVRAEPAILPAVPAEPVISATEPVSEPEVPPESSRFEFCLQELRRVRLPNWPPAEVHADPVRSQLWRDAERLVATHQREIGVTQLIASHPVQSSCLGSAEADAAGTRLRFFLFPVLWPSTADQATAEAVFEIESGGGTIRGYVNSLRRAR